MRAEPGNTGPRTFVVFSSQSAGPIMHDPEKVLESMAAVCQAVVLPAALGLEETSEWVRYVHQKHPSLRVLAEVVHCQPQSLGDLLNSDVDGCWIPSSCAPHIEWSRALAPGEKLVLLGVNLLAVHELASTLGSFQEALARNLVLVVEKMSPSESVQLERLVDMMKLQSLNAVTGVMDWTSDGAWLSAAWEGGAEWLGMPQESISGAGDMSALLRRLTTLTYAKWQFPLASPEEWDCFDEDAVCLVATRPLEADEALSVDMFDVANSSRGLSPRLLPRLVGQTRLRYALQRGSPLTFGDILWRSQL